MTTFRYQAYDPNGKVVEGFVDALSESDALNKLYGQGIVPFRAKPASSDETASSLSAFRLSRASLSLGERARMMRQLAVLLKSGITLDRALRILTLQPPTKRVKAVVTVCAEGVAAGKPLSQTLSGQQSGFLADEIGMIKAGEQTGSLAAVLEELGTMLERRQELRGRIVSALAYPAVLLVMALLSLTVIATVLIPNMMPLFEQSGAELPLIVRVITAVTAAFRDHSLLILLIALLVSLLAFYAFRQPAMKAVWDRLLLRLPIAGDVEVSRICRTLATLLHSGLALQSAMSAVRDVAANSITRQQLSHAIDDVTAGVKLAEAFKVLTALDSGSRQMIAIGEETNKLEAMLMQIAINLESETTQRIERLMALLTPLLTIALGVLVGGLIMSVMRAILSVNELAVS
jgi:general secretion pathway protein F